MKSTFAKYQSYWKKGWISSFLVLGCFSYLLKVSWFKWGSLVIDTGRELYVPLRILSGKILYKDIMYIYGPFSPHFNALLCLIFGIHLRSFVISGVLTTLVMCVLIYKISRIFLNVIFSTLSLLTFLFVFAFGNLYEAGIFNFILPYSYPSIHSVTFAILALFFYYRAITKGKRIYSYLCGFSVMLSLLARIEVGIVLVVSMLLGIFLDFRKAFKKRCTTAIVYCFLPLFVAGLIYNSFTVATKNKAYKNFQIMISAFLENLNMSNSFQAELSGTSDLPNNIKWIFLTALYYFAIIFIFFIVGKVSLQSKRFFLIKKKGVVVILTLIITAVAILFQRKFFPYYLQYRCTPFICILVFIIAYRRYLMGVEMQKFLFLAVFSIFSFLLLTRMLFNVWAGHYGFYLLVAGMVCYYIFFLKIAPEIFIAQREMQRYYKFTFIILSIAFIMSHATISFFMYKIRTMGIVSPRGTMFVRPAYFRCKELLRYIRDKTESSASLIVFPEGASLNFFSCRDNPMYCLYFLPTDSYRPNYEKNFIKDLEDKAIKYAVIVNRSTSEYGAARFGIDYAQDIMRYLAEDYVIKRQFGPMPFTTNEISLWLLEKKAAF